MNVIDLMSVESCIDRSLGLFRQTYRDDAVVGGGWYHRLATGEPGPSATAVGLSSFYVLRGSLDFLDNGLSFLHARQIRSEDRTRNGGWPVNTSFGHPVTEATGWVARFLGLARIGLLSGNKPDARAACTWLISNQNEDGGWGSFRGRPSLTWHTCMALRALVVLDSTNAAIGKGIKWLLDSRSTPSDAWGEVPSSSSPSVVHTAFTLTTLFDTSASLRFPAAARVIEDAYSWLASSLDTGSIGYDSSRIEVHTNFAHYPDLEQQFVWTSNVWHYALPVALSALVRHPTQPDPYLICSAVQTIIGAQLESGYWPNIDNAKGISVWAVWPFLEALADVSRRSAIRKFDKITWASSQTLVAQRPNSAAEALPCWKQVFGSESCGV